MKKMNETITNEKGQALIFVVATMTVALAVGVGVSLRNLSSISRTSRTDTGSRAQAAAEGGAENVLSRSESELSSMVGAPAEEIVFSPTSGDNVTAVANVTVANYNIPAGLGFLPLEIKQDQVSEVKLDGGAVTVCWSSQVEGKSSDIYYSSYNESGDIVRNGVEARSRDGFPSNYSTGGTFEGADGGNSDFANCHDVSLPSNAAGLRIRAINADTRLGVYPSSGSLPDQGYLITSVGKLDVVEEGEDAEAVVTVVRSAPYMPGIFDFGVYSGSNADVLN